MADIIVFYFVTFLSLITEIKFTSAQFYNFPSLLPNLYQHQRQQQRFYNPLQRASLHFQPQPYSSNDSPFSLDQHVTTIQNQHPPEIFQGFVRTKDLTTINRKNGDTTQGRLLSASAFSKISETLGALNTVGHFIVNMTRGQDSDEIDNEFIVEDSVPDAILTITKNVLGQNMTKTIEPLIKRVGKDEDKFKLNAFDQKRNKTRNKIKKDTHSHLTPMTTASTIAVSSNSDSYAGKENENRCKTPNGRPGLCEDLSNCPALLLDLSNLRESLCFKSLFVPGVCCPISQSTLLTTERPIRLTTKSSPPSLSPVFDVTTVRSTPQQNLVLIPQFTTVTTTAKPISSSLNLSPSSSISSPLNVVSLDDCGQQEYSSGRIVGGIESPNGEWPWLAAIFLHGPKRTEFWCGGSLIGSKYILTAAHCTRDSRQKPFAARQFTVRLGDVDLSTDSEPSSPQTFRVKEVRAHERFSRVGFYNDVAILVLDKPARKSKYVIPVCLPKPKSHSTYRDKLSGKRATVVGWGTTYYGGKESTMLRQADLPVWRNDDCDRAYFQPITNNFLCAGYSEGGVDACQGDSGGPLMMKFDSRWVQIGIVSFGNKCGEPGYPGVYTRISEYIDWIKEHTRD